MGKHLEILRNSGLIAVLAAGICVTAEKYAAAQVCSCNGGGLTPSISVSPTISHVGDTVTISQIGAVLGSLNNCYVTNGIAYVMYPNGASALVAGPPTGNGKNGIQIYENHFNMLGATPLNPCAGPDQVQCFPTVIGAQAGCVAFTTTYQIDAADVGRQLGPATTPNPRPDGLAGGQVNFFQPGVAKKIHFVAACDAFRGDNGLPEGGNAPFEITIVSPGIAVSKQCVSNCAPPLSGSASYGQPINFTGSVTNTGDTTLTNVTIVDTPATTITFATTTRLGNAFPAAGGGILIAGDSIAYAGSYPPTGNFCGPFTDTVVASGTDTAPAPKTVTATNSATCTVCTSPSITVTKQCPATNPVPGSLLIFSGTVCNNGNVPLTNVTVVDNQSLSWGNLVASYPLLTNGECRSFMGIMVVPLNVCSITDILTAQGTNICTGQGVSASVTTNCASPYCITQVVANGNKLTFSFTTQTGHTNIVQYTEVLNPPNWQVLTNVIGDGSTATISDMVTNSQRFYRVLSQ